MIEIKVEYDGNVLLTNVPKEKYKFADELGSIGLRMSPDKLILSNDNEQGYEIRFYSDSELEHEVVSRIGSEDTLSQLNELAYLIENSDEQAEMLARLTKSNAASVMAMYKDLYSPAAVQTDKLVINAVMSHKVTDFHTKPYIVEKAVSLTEDQFFYFKTHLMKDSDIIADNIDHMYEDKNGVQHCLLVYDSEGGDGILVDSSCYDYARYCPYVPKAKELVEQHNSPKITLTYGEREIHKLLGELVSNISLLVQTGRTDFTLEDALNDIDTDIEYVHNLLLKAAAEILGRRSDIKSVRVNDLAIPFQPELTVIAEEISEDMTADPDESESQGIGGFSVS